MRVVHLTSAHPPFDVRIFQKECRSLADAGHEVTLVAPHDRDELAGNVTIRAVRKSVGRTARMTVGAWRVYRKALRLDADVYHFHDPELIPAGLLLRAQGKKVVYDLHEDAPQDILGKDYLPPAVRRPLALALDCLERSSSRLFSGLVAATPAIAGRFVNSNHTLAIVRNFPRREEFDSSASPNWADRAMTVVYAGCITRDRGIWEITEAINLVSDRLNATLSLAGIISPVELRARVKKQPGWQRVIDLGYLSRNRLFDLLGTARAGLLVFHPDPNNIRAQPNKLFEYMAAGIPVIASNFPLWREIVAGVDCGVLVNPLRPREIAEAIEYLLSNPRESQEMGARGRRAVQEHYQWEAEGQQLLGLYRRLERA